MKKLLPMFFFVAFLLFSGRLLANTLTIYPLDHNRCKYVLTDNNDMPVAAWTGDCSAALGNAASIDIMDRSELGRKLKKINRSIALKNIRVVHLMDRTAINKLESQKIKVIKLRRLNANRAFHINNPSNNTAIAPAQDYNSSRSNKANSIAPAQDYNSSRSNKANSFAPAQDYNSSRSNKANSIAPAQDYNSSRSNKANSIAPAQDYNSSRSNKANSIAPAQDYNSSRSNKGGLILEGGFASGNSGNHISNGFSVAIAYQLRVTNLISIETIFSYYSNEFQYGASHSFPEKYRGPVNKSVRNSGWNSYALMAGPSATFRKSRLNAVLYAKAGIVYTNIPDQFIGVPVENKKVTEESGVVKFSGNNSSVALSTGIRLSYRMSQTISLFVDPCFITSLNRNISYREKNPSKAINAEGVFDEKMFMKLPYEEKKIQWRNTAISIGFYIAIH